MRWILLAVGIAFVLLIYLLGRSRRRRKHSVVDELEDDLPEFSAKSLDDMDEGVGDVRIVSGSGINPDLDLEAEVSISDSISDSSEDTRQISSTDRSSDVKLPSDFIVLYIMPIIDLTSEQFLLGSQINSSAQAMGLTFGEMNIFHYKVAARNVFSMANMLEPGSFDADTIHEIKTSGLTVFMKIAGKDPLDDLTEMLQRSYQLAGLLGARLCNHKRETLTEQDAENYRAQVAMFAPADEPEHSCET
ncbi:MAG: hypothetical protein COB77_03620 [Gammaproteobacteria bacterium]|nr:MAG: hypothetical protein COB77_03620 [Gammaproteobacteria bacterium]